MAVMGEGKLVPTGVVQKVLKRYIELNVQRGTTRILLDGFPRSMDQTTLFETSVSIQNFTKSCSCGQVGIVDEHAGFQN